MLKSCGSIIPSLSQQTGLAPTGREKKRNDSNITHAYRDIHASRVHLSPTLELLPAIFLCSIFQHVVRPACSALPARLAIIKWPSSACIEAPVEVVVGRGGKSRS